jgi:N-ethylmaleimide reductase
MPYSHLFEPYEHADLHLPHRVAMAPLTRNRAKDTVPGELNATYYAQRADAAIIVAEGTFTAPDAQGYLDIPGLHTDAQQTGWADVIAAVRAAGDAKFVIQLMHCGRVAHPIFCAGAPPVAPSAIKAPGQVFTGTEQVDFVEPVEISTDDLAAVRDDYVASARRAIAAGADGVELHAANGYLLHQFLSENTNQRTDGYGTDVAGRIRFVVEVVAAVADAIGVRRTGLRISPGHEFNGIAETDPRATYDALLRALAPYDLLYLHVMETQPFVGYSTIAQARELFPGTLMGNDGFTSEFDVAQADQMVADGRMDLVAYGRRFIANPDLPRRLREGALLNEVDEDTLYGGDGHGYTDYPTLDEVASGMA